MLHPYISKLAIAILTVNLTLLNTSCVNSSVQKSAGKESTPQANVGSAVPEQATAKPSPSNAPIADITKTEAYQAALDKAHSAKTISASAQSKDDWDLVVSYWQQAIELVKSIPSHNKQAKSRIAEYKQNLKIAQQRSSLASKEPKNEPTVIVLSPKESGGFSSSGSCSEAQARYRAAKSRYQTFASANAESGFDLFSTSKAGAATDLAEAELDVSTNCK